MLRETVQHVAHASPALRNFRCELFVAQSCDHLTQTLVTLRELRPRRFPILFRDWSGTRPILTSLRLDSAARKTTSRDVCPRRYVQHELPDIVRRGDRSLRGILSRHSLEQLGERRSVPGITGERLPNLDCNALAFSLCPSYQMLA